MKPVLCVTRTFPRHPGDREGNFVFHSMQAVARKNVEISVIHARPYLPAWAGRLIGRCFTSADASAFPDLSSLETVVHVSIPRHRLKPLSNALLDRSVGTAIERSLQGGRFGLVHGHGEDVAPVVARASHAAGVPCVVTIHGIDTAPRGLGAPMQRARYAKALRDVDRVILVGEPLRAPFLDVVRRQDHFRIVPNGFSPPPPDVKGRAWSHLRSEERVELISVSNVVEGKGIDFTIEALARLAARGHSRWRYRVVGEGPQRSALEGRVKALGLGEAVEFLGARPHEEVYGLLAGADVFVLPSYREAFGIAYLEAMAMGLLAIGVRGQGPDAFVRSGETGLLVEPRDANSLAAALEFAFGHRDRCRAMATAGRHAVWADWTWEAHAARLVLVYEELAGG